MCKCRSGNNVADGIDSRNGCAESAIYHDFIALNRYAELLKTDILDVGLNADRREYNICCKGLSPLLALNLNLTLVIHHRYALDCCSGHNANSQTAEHALHTLCNLLILKGHKLRHILDNGHFYTQRGVEKCKLAADSTRTHNDHCLGQLLERQSIF